MVAPVDRLPPEILSRIFVILVRASRYAFSVLDTADYTVRLSSVCVRWRQVAISTTLLWSFIDLYSSVYSLRSLEYLNMCYERSVNAPLSVRIGRYGRECCEKTVDEQLASLLGAYAPRLESLDIAYYYPNFVKEVLSFLLVQKAASQVRKLSLYVSEGIILADSQLPQHALDKLLEPLQSLYLERVAFDWDTIQCQNLVELQLSALDSIARPSPSQLASLLNANPMIRTLRLSSFENFTYEPNLPPIMLPELQHLGLQMGLKFTQVVLALLTPGTQDITLQISFHVPDSYLDSFTKTLCEFFQRSRIVTLRVPTNEFIPFSSIAPYLPHLETLRVFEPRSGYDLSGVHTHAELLPMLHTVELVESTTLDVESGLGTVLSLPSVRQILFSIFYSVDATGKTTSMDAGEVRKWLSGQGVTANVRMAPELRFRSTLSPFW